MSIVQNPLIGRTKNQAGGMVFSTVNGQNIMKAKPFQYRDKNSTAQQKVRAVFLLIVGLAATMKFFIADWFETSPVKMSPYSKLISQLRAAFTYVSTAWVYKPKNVVIGSGSLAIGRNFGSTFSGDGSVTVVWDDAILFENEKSTDKVYFLFTSETGTESAIVDSGATRTTGTATVSVPTGITSAKGFISYPIFVSADGAINSPIMLSDTDTAATL